MFVASSVYKADTKHDAVCEDIGRLAALFCMVHRLPGKFGLDGLGACNLETNEHARKDDRGYSLRQQGQCGKAGTNLLGVVKAL